jgi:hypothetical protein
VAESSGDLAGEAVDDIEVALLRAGIDTLIDWIRSKWRSRPKSAQIGSRPVRGDQEITVELGRDKEAILAGEVSDAALHLYSGEIRAVLSQMEIRRENISLLESQRAQWGEALVPPVIVNSIRSENRELDSLARRLQSLLQAILGQPLPESFRGYLALSADIPEAGA